MADLGELRVKVSADISNLQSQLDKAGGVTQDFANKANASIAKTNTSFSALGSTVTKSASTLSNLASSFVSVVNPAQLLAVAVAAGAVALVAYINSVSEAERVQRAFDEAMSESASKVAGEVSSLTQLVTIARDVSLSTKARQQAVSELNKEYPQYLGNLTLENINTEAVQKAIDAQTAAMVRRAKIRGAENLIAKETEKLLKAETEASIENVSKFDIFKSLIQEGLHPGTGTGDLATRAINNQKEAALNASIAITTYNKKLRELLTDSANAGDLFVPKISKPAKPPKGSKAGKADDPFTIDLADLNDNLKDALAEVQGIKFLELAVNENFLKQKLALYKRYGKYEGEINLEIAKNQLELIKEQTRFIESQRIPLVHPKDVITPQLDDKINTKKSVNLSDDIIRAGINLDIYKEKATEASKVITGLLAPAFDELFTQITDGSRVSFESFIKVLGKTIQQLAATILKAAALAAIFSLINPAGVGGGKGGLSFFGAFKKLLGFAEGGHVQGSGSKTSDSILARLSAGEYVIKASAVDKYGVGFFEKLNAGMIPNQRFGNTVNTNSLQNIFKNLPRFAEGGLVSGVIPSSISGITGASVNVTVSGSFKGQGKELLYVIDNATATRNRNG